MIGSAPRADPLSGRDDIDDELRNHQQGEQDIVVKREIPFDRESIGDSRSQVLQMIEVTS
jgi:hypothetical protein